MDENVNNYGINNHKINIKLIDGNKVQITIVNPKNDIYESITHISDLKSLFSYQDTYAIILECFNKTPNYIFTTAFKDDTYYLKFQTMFHNYQMTFIIKVERKNSLSNEDIDNIKKQLTIMQNTIDELTKEKESIELIHQREIQDLKEIIDDLHFLDIKFSKNNNGKTTTYLYIPLSSTEVSLNNVNDPYKIKSLYKLEKLTINIYSELLDFENKYLKMLVLNAPKIKTLNGINKFLNLEVLELVSCDNLYDIKSYLSETKIKKIIFRRCGENQKRNMISYCNAKNIELYYI
jgi:hypothetical protein